MSEIYICFSTTWWWDSTVNVTWWNWTIQRPLKFMMPLESLRSRFWFAFIKITLLLLIIYKYLYKTINQALCIAQSILAKLYWEHFFLSHVILSYISTVFFGAYVDAEHRPHFRQNSGKIIKLGLGRFFNRWLLWWKNYCWLRKSLYILSGISMWKVKKVKYIYFK